METLLVTEDAIRTALYEVYDPELGINVVDLGLIYGIAVAGGCVCVDMTLTTPGCPLHDTLTNAVRSAIESFIPGVTSVSVNLVWEPPWCPDRISEEGRMELGIF